MIPLRSITAAALLGAALAFVGIRLILAAAARFGWRQRAPDLHHTHKSPVPRLGGLALAFAFIGVELFIAIVNPEQRAATPGRTVVLLSSLAMFALGFWDDLKPLGAKRKLAAQAVIAAAVCAFGLGIQQFRIPFSHTIVHLQGWGGLLTVVWLVGMTNLINLIDGVDGLAAGICFMLMALLAYVGHHGGNFELLAAGMAGALLAFLGFNFPPARIYLGDGGAYFLGFQIGLFALINSHKGTVAAALVAPLFVLALPITDTALAILRRGLRGLPIFRPDRRHLHHRLLGMGLSRRTVVIGFYAVTLLFLVLGLIAYSSRGEWLPILFGLAVVILLFCAGQLSFSRDWFALGRTLGNSREIRQEIQYAQSLTKWLILEGRRGVSIEELWRDLAHVARKLGFSSVKLTLTDGQRVWHANGRPAAVRAAQHELAAGRLGRLELEAPRCAAGSSRASSACPRAAGAASHPCPCVGHAQLFDNISELVAEGWLGAARNFQRDDSVPLRFGMNAQPRPTRNPIRPCGPA